jgi:formylglycine-generating enzyme required for sulfatase activity
VTSWRVCVLLAAGCGRFGFASREVEVDSTVAVDSATDATALCASTQGPSMVEIPATPPYCIDSTEVTRAQYAAFLATSPPTTGQPAGCASNDGFIPQAEWPPSGTTDTLPVVGVDWCDAHAFCAWAGKRLCGAIGGGALSLAQAAGATSQWYAACSMNGTRTYPYGSTFTTGLCPDGAGVIAVGSLATCQSYPGLFDMSGNAHEWLDACDGGNNCMLLGGGIGGHAAADMRCQATVSLQRTLQGDDSGQSWIRETGFRCCR